MTSTRGIRAGRAFVELFADDSKLVAGLRAAQVRLNRFSASVRAAGLKMVAIGTAMVAPLVGAARTFARTGDEMAKMSRRTGVAVESLSELAFAAEQSGADVTALENGIRRMQRTVYDAGRGLSTATQALADLGLTANALAGLSPEEQFKALAEHISQVEDPSRRAAIAMQLLGRQGAMLLPLMSEGAAGIEALQAEARRLGLTMSSADAAHAEEFTDAMNRLRRTVHRALFAIGSAVAPVLQRVVDWLTQAAMKVREWIEANKGLVVSALKIGAGVLVAGAALLAFSGIVTLVAVALGGVILAVKALGVVLAGVKVVLAVLLSPIGLVAAAVAALGATILYMTGAAGKAFGWLRERFASLSNFAGESFRAIADALKAGDIPLAAEIMWLSLRLAWQKGTQQLRITWATAWKHIQTTAATVWDSMRAGHETAVHAMVVAMIEGSRLMQRAWAWLKRGLGHDMNNFVAGLRYIYADIRGLVDGDWDKAAYVGSIEQQRTQREREIEGEYRQGTRQADQWRDAMRREARAEHDQQMARIVADHAGRIAAINTESADAIEKIDAELAETRQQWEAVRRRAGSLVPGADGPGGPDPDDFLSRARNMMAGLDDLLDGLSVSRQETRGTFNAAAIQGLQAGVSAQEKVARNTDEIRREMRRSREILENFGGSAFA